MRIHRLIPIIVVLFILAATTMTTVQNNLVGVESGTTSAQQAAQAEAIPVQTDGVSSIAASDTTSQAEEDLFLDAAEVEKRALDE
ncbi:MAG TPA: hypothetical protein VM656_06505, partial [Pyrinomonadaceae bacterium]|nr:hypothetical protein [Pyrinomonadaceae bacterium]